MSRPKRFQARRGQKLEPGQKQVGRNTLWGNPYPVEGMVDPAKPPRLVQRYADKWGESRIVHADHSAPASSSRYEGIEINCGSW